MKRITKIDAIVKAKAKKLKVAAYARVSTSLGEQLLSLEAQKSHYEKLIKSRDDWEFSGVYFDEGISGTKMEKRDGLLAMLGDCEQGKIDYILVKSISRFSRNTLESVEIVRKLYSLGVYIFFEKENIDTGKMEGELLLSILSSLAESESHSISENMSWSIQKQFKEGTYKMRYLPFGYESINGVMIVNPEQREIVQFIFDSILNGLSPSQVAKELNDKRIVTKRGGKWTSHTIVGMIRNEKYIGDALFQKTYTDDIFTRHINYGERTQYYVSDHHEAIVTQEVYDKANAIIDRNGQEKGVIAEEFKYQNRYALTSKLICKECGNTMKRVKLPKNFGFACKTHLKDVESCSMKAINEDKVKAAFATMMNKLIYARDKLLKPYALQLDRFEQEQYLDELNELNDDLEKNVDKRQKVTVLFSKGLIDPNIYTREMDKLNILYEQKQKAKDILIKQLSGGTGMRISLTELLQFTAKGEMLDDFDETLFTKFVDYIEVYSRSEIGFVMKCGPIFKERID